MNPPAGWRRAARMLVPLVRVVAGLFFDRRYLRGKHFDEALTGWKWVARALWFQKVLGFNRSVPWPVSPFIRISDPGRLHFHPDDLNNFQSFGCYYQCFKADIFIGKGVQIAPNVGLITANHDPVDLATHRAGRDIRLGADSWVGMNAVVLPGVELGPRTIVAAGAVVTRSVPEGHCVLAGVPAKVVKRLSSAAEGAGEGPSPGAAHDNVDEPRAGGTRNG